VEIAIEGKTGYLRDFWHPQSPERPPRGHGSANRPLRQLLQKRTKRPEVARYAVGDPIQAIIARPLIVFRDSPSLSRRSVNATGGRLLSIRRAVGRPCHAAAGGGAPRPEGHTGS